MTNEEINSILASKAADLLASWAGLAPGAKVNFGANAGMAAVLMLASGAVTDANVTADTRFKMASYIKAKLDGRADGGYLCFYSDYGPGHALRELSASCGLHGGVWPNKSMLTVNKVYGDGSGSNAVTISTGYHGRTTTHYLTNDGWLVAKGVNVDKALLVVVRAACERGELADAVQWHPFKV